MTIKFRNPMCFAEYYLRHKEKIEKLTPQERKFFWDQRSWHPLVKMCWVDETKSDGAGIIVYPDGTTRTYTVLYQLDKKG